MAGERNKVMGLLDVKGYDPTMIEDLATTAIYAALSMIISIKCF